MSQQEIEKIRSAGWRQGSILNLCGDIPSMKNGLYMLISQDCDILHHHFEHEPSVEAIYLTPVNAPDGNLTYGKNPRKIHFKLRDENYYESLIKNRHFIDRKCLAQMIPNQELTPSSETRRYIVEWITKKYHRDAFPDAFNNRLKNTKGIQKILEKHGKNIIGLFIRLNTENEIAETKPYKMQLIMIGDIEDISANKDELRFNLNQTLENIVDIIHENTGIEVLENYETRFLNEITVAEYLNMKKWDFDFLSYRDFPEGKTL